MTTPEQQPTTPKRAARFGDVQEQFGTIGRKEKPATESQKEPTIDAEVENLKSEKVKTSISKEEEKGQQTLRLPLSLRKWLRMQAPVEERDISDIVTDALLDYKKKIGQ
jgi:hypothetical protein